MYRNHAFSLMELLVVVVLIAGLMGMLLPVLATARQAGMSMQCQANLRTMQQGWIAAMLDDEGVIPWTRHLHYDGADGRPNWVGRLKDALINGPGIYGTNVKSFNSCPTAQERYQDLHYHTMPWGYVANTRWESELGRSAPDGGQVLAKQPPWLNQGKNWQHIHRPSRYPWFMDAEVYRNATHYQAHHFAPSNAGSLANWGVGPHHGGQEVVNVSFADGAVRGVAMAVIREATAGGESFAWFENH